MIVRLDIEAKLNGKGELVAAVGGLRELEKGAGAASKAMQSIFQGIGQGVGQAAFQAISSAVTNMAGAVKASVSSVIELGGKLTDLSSQTGVSVEGLQRLEFGAKLAGASMEDVTKAIGKMQQGITGGDSVFARLGLDLQALRAMNPEEQFNATAEAIRGIADPTQQAAAAVEAFGKGGLALLPAIKEGFAAAGEEAQRLGLIMSTETAAAADALGDSLDKLSMMWDALMRNIGAVIVSSQPLHTLIEGLSDIMGQLSGSVHDSSDVLRDFVDGAVIFVAEALVHLADAVQIGMDAWDALKLTWLSVKVAAADLGIAINQLDLAWGKATNNKTLQNEAKQNIAVLQGMKKAAQDQAQAVVKSNATQTDSIQKLRGAFVKLAADVAAARGKLAAGGGGLSSSGGSVFVSDKDVETERKRIETLADILRKARYDAGQLAEKIGQENAKKLDTLADQALASMKIRFKEEADLRREADEAAKKAGEDALREGEARVRANQEWVASMNDVIDAIHAMGDAFGGTAGEIAHFAAAGLQIFTNWKNAAKLSAAEKASIGIQGVTEAYNTKSTGKGAMAGAAAGTAIMPGWGTLIGAGVGALAGYMGGKAENKKQLAELNQQLMDTYGSVEEIRKAFDRAGMSMDKALSWKKASALKQEIDNLAKAEAAREKRIQGLSTATRGLELRTQGLMASLEKGASGGAEAFERMGTFALVTFAGLVRETGDAIAALNEMGGALDTLAAAQEKYGFSAGASLQQLLDLRNIITSNQDVADSISGLNQMMKGLGDAGLINQQVFAALGADATSLFNTLIERGVEAPAALGLMAPTLQQIWEMQRKYHFEVDAGTQALLDQAEAQGVVGAQFMSTNEAILQVLIAIGDVLGATLPAALQKMGNTAQQEFGKMAAAANSVNIPSIPGGIASTEGSAEEFQGPAFAEGGYVSKPTVALIGEAGPEYVIPASKMRGGGAAGGSNTYHITVVESRTPQETADAVYQCIKDKQGKIAQLGLG